MNREIYRNTNRDKLPKIEILNYFKRLLVPALTVATFAAVKADNPTSLTDAECLNIPCDLSTTSDITQSRTAGKFDLVNLDTNSDGILNPESNLHSGDIIFRQADGKTQVEAKEYLVPSNQVYVDIDGDGVMENNEVIFARIVVVEEDNLTFLFKENNSQVEAVFPNGTGRPGANTVASVRRINAILPADWGQAESERENLIPYPDGTMPNYFGDVTLGTRFYINSNPENDVDSRQEVHGTFRAHAGSVDGVSLLGTEISGGCIRHSNEAIRYMASRVKEGDIVITMYTPEDDVVDNQFTLYNRTLLAANMLPVGIDQELIDSFADTLLFRPRNIESVQMPETGIDTSVWMDFSAVGFPTTFLPVEHPFTRGNYNLIPCGSENLWIQSKITGKELLHNETGIYNLNLPEFISAPNNDLIRVSDFYLPKFISFAEVENQLNRLSLGDPEAGIFEYLFSDLVYQYAEYLIRQSGQNVDLVGGMDYAVASMNDGMLRQVQLTTGVLPVRYFPDTPIADGVVGDRLGIMTNRTMIQHAMNVFYGTSAPTYELDPRVEANQNAFLIQDMNIWPPAMDNEVVRTEGPGVSTTQLITSAVENNKPVIFRISYYRYLADLSFAKNLPAGHYFSLIPEYSKLEAGYIGVYDTMHPFSILLVPFNEIPQLFTTVTVG